MSAELDGVELRVLTTADELSSLPPFEHRIWGAADVVSVNMLVALVSEGGVAIGAFDGADIVGAVIGFRTHEPWVLHSHYMAVDPRFRRRGLGVGLKQAQRRWCLDQGLTMMRWTFDPLQLANAHLNLRVLGAVGVRYHVDHYGTLGGINGTLASDRLTVEWDLTGARPRPHGDLAVDVPVVDATDIAASNEVAQYARSAVREAVAPRLGDGWVVVDLDRARRRYWLAPPSSTSSAS